MLHARALFVTLLLPAVGRAAFATTPLDDYVNRDDGAFAWREVPELAISGPGWSGVVLNVTSQKWLSDEDWGASWGPTGGLWWHLVLVVAPDELTRPGWAGLWITGGSNSGEPPSPRDSDVAVASRLACLLYTSPSPRDGLLSRMPSSA